MQSAVYPLIQLCSLKIVKVFFNLSNETRVSVITAGSQKLIAFTRLYFIGDLKQNSIHIHNQI